MPPPRTAGKWAEVSRILPRDAAEPGPFRPDRVPYFIPVYEAAASGKYRRITVVAGSQMGKTDLGLNIVGHKLDDDPAPVLFIAPTKKLVESISRDRFAKLVVGCPSLADKLATGGLDNLTEKFISGVALRFMWASSATELASHPAALVVLDERDRMPDDVAGEGDPVTLASARMATYPDALMVIFTTPTVEGASPGETLFLAGNRLRWHWPCKDCGTYFEPRFKHLKWPKGADKDTIYDLGAWVQCPHCADEHVAECDSKECTGCSGKHTERDKDKLNALGTYLGPGQTATLVDGSPVIEGELKESRNASFWVSGLCSPWKTLEDRTSDWLEAVETGNPETIKGVLNTRFGELYKVKGYKPTVAALNSIKLDYELGTVHKGAWLLTSGVDVQRDSIYYVVRAWGKHDESWLVEYGQLFGDTADPEIWDKLSVLIDKRYYAPGDAQPYLIVKMGVDSGFNSDEVYTFAKDYSDVVMATDGADRMVGRPVSASRIDIDWRGRTIKQGLQLWRFDKHHFRSWIYGRMMRPETSKGRWQISNDCVEDYIKQVVAEECVTLPSGRQKWQKRKGHRHNHYLDAEVNARVAAHVVDVENAIAQMENPVKRKRARKMRSSY